MLTILTIVTPVFGLILAGWLAARTGYLSPAGGKALSEFTFKIAMPALLFRGTLQSGVLTGSPLELLAAYFGASALTWLAASLIAGLVLRRPAADHAAIAMGATFGNTVMLGIPLADSAFGPGAAAPMALIISIEAPLLWALATLHMKLATGDARTGLGKALGGLFLDLLTNPIVMSLMLGIAGREMGLSLPPLADKVLEQLGQGAIPTALIAVGAALAALRGAAAMGSAVAISVVKQLVYPAIAYVLAFKLFVLPPLWASVVVLFAAMPVGVNGYLFAVRYGRGTEPVAAALSLSTAVSALTLTALLYLLGVGAGKV